MTRRMTDLLMAIVFAATLFGLSRAAQSGATSQASGPASVAADQVESTAKPDPKNDLTQAVQEMRKEMHELRQAVETLRANLEPGNKKEPQSGPVRTIDNKTVRQTLGAVAIPKSALTAVADTDEFRAAAAKTPPRFEARCYPVADLLTYPAGSQLTNVKDKFDKLITLITDVIEPSTWKSGGGKGSIRPYESTLSLVVTQSPSTHTRISSLLRNLRMLQSWQISLELAIVDRPMPDMWNKVKKLTSVEGGEGDVVYRLTDDERTGLLDAARCNLAAKVVQSKATLDFGGTALIPFHSGADTDLVHPALVVEATNSMDRYGVNLRFTGCDLASGKSTHASIAANFPNKKGALIVLRKSDTGEKSKPSATPILLIVRPRIFVPEEEEELLESR